MGLHTTDGVAHKVTPFLFAPEVRERDKDRERLEVKAYRTELTRSYQVYCLDNALVKIVELAMLMSRREREEKK